jgi:hypothetical protein
MRYLANAKPTQVVLPDIYAHITFHVCTLPSVKRFRSLLAFEFENRGTGKSIVPLMRFYNNLPYSISLRRVV